MFWSKNSICQGPEARENMACSSEFKLEHGLQEGKWHELRLETWTEAKSEGSYWPVKKPGFHHEH